MIWFCFGVFNEGFIENFFFFILEKIVNFWNLLSYYLLEEFINSMIRIIMRNKLWYFVCFYCLILCF